MLRGFLMTAAAVLMLSTAAYATYTTVNISSIAKTAPMLGGGSYPTGTSTGNTGLSVPFAISGSNGNALVYLSSSKTASTSLDLSSLNLSGQVSFYALLNNYYGTAGLDEYDVTVTTKSGQSVTYKSIGGVDTRDYNANVFTNSLASTTLAWFDNGKGQRLDLRQFTLPTSFASDVVSSLTIKQNNNGDLAFLSGVTFSNTPGLVATPEPASLALLATGVLGAAAWRRRRNRG